MFSFLLLALLLLPFVARATAENVGNGDARSNGTEEFFEQLIAGSVKCTRWNDT